MNNFNVWDRIQRPILTEEAKKVQKENDLCEPFYGYFGWAWALDSHGELFSMGTSATIQKEWVDHTEQVLLCGKCQEEIK